MTWFFRSRFAIFCVLAVMPETSVVSRVWSCGSLDIGQQHLMGVHKAANIQKSMEHELEARIFGLGYAGIKIVR